MASSAHNLTGSSRFKYLNTQASAVDQHRVSIRRRHRDSDVVVLVLHISYKNNNKKTSLVIYCIYLLESDPQAFKAENLK